MAECEHDYKYSGVVYEVAEWPLPGSGAHAVSYYDHYFCRKCLDHRWEQLPTTSNTYEQIRFGARPKKEES